jgi:HK97 gp10 family phage protein
MEIRVQIEGIDDALRALDNTVRPDAIRAGLMAAALYVEGQAKIKVTRIDFGFMVNSIYAVAQGRSDYTQRLSEAKQANPLATMQPEESPGPLEAIVAVGAEYAIYHEMGTRYMSAAPFMRPALEGSRNQIGQIISEAIQRRARR